MTTQEDSPAAGKISTRSAHIPRSGYRLGRFIWTHPEVQGRRVRALTRALAWQTWQRVVRRPWPVALSPTIELLCYPHSTASAAVLYCRYPDWREMHLLLDVLRPGDHFVDVGANVGVYSLLASTIPGIEVWAFEPASVAAERAAENIRRNGLEGRCHLLKAAVGRSRQQGYLTVGLGTMNRITKSPSGEPTTHEGIEAVEIVSLDDVIPATAQAAVAVLKIDVEGEEMAVLEGAVNLLARSNAIVIVEPNEPTQLAAFFAKHGFEPCTYDPPTRQITLTAIPPPHQANSIYIHDVEAVRRRLAAGGSRQ